MMKRMAAKGLVATLIGAALTGPPPLHAQEQGQVWESKPNGEDGSWRPDMFTGDPQLPAAWKVVSAEETSDGRCVLVWDYNRTSRIVISRGGPGMVVARFIVDDVSVVSGQTFDAVIVIDGERFVAPGTVWVTQSAPWLEGASVHGILMVDLPEAFLESFSMGRSAVLSAEGISSGPIMLVSTSTGARALRRCVDKPDASGMFFAHPTPTRSPSVVFGPPAPRLAPPPAMQLVPRRAPVGPAPAAPRPPVQARGAILRDPPRVSQSLLDAYPAEAVRDRLEGTVWVDLGVDPAGRVVRCVVKRSSGHSVLDEAACRGFTRFGRFDPALDAAGAPTEGAYSTRVTYRLSAVARMQ